MAKRSFALLLLCFGVLLALPTFAVADTGDVVEPQHEPATSGDGFQSGVCYENQVEEDPTKTDTTNRSVRPKPRTCSSPRRADTRRSRSTSTSSGMKPSSPGVVEPLIEPYEDRVLKTERVDLPVGFTEDPQSSPKCSNEDFEAIGEIPGSGGQMGLVPKCDPSTIVGRNETWLVVNTANAVPVPGAPPGNFLPGAS